MAVTTTNLGVITAYGDAVAAGYTGTKAEWQALMASYATVGQQAVDAKNAAVAAKDTAVAKATEATTAATTATTKASEASASAQSIAQSAAQIQENTDDITQLKSELTTLAPKEDMLKAFPTDTASGGVASFADGANVPVKSLIVNIDLVQSGSGDPSPDNVRPISGWSEVNVQRTGKNLIVSEILNANIDATGAIFGNPQFNMYVAPIKKGQIYTATCGSELVCGFFTSFPAIGSVAYDEARVVQTNYTFTAPIDGYVAFRIIVVSDVKPQLEIGSAKTDYEPYSDNPLLINIALGQTVYGGTLDVVSGELTLYNGGFKADGTDPSGWQRTTAYGSATRFDRNIPDIKVNSTDDMMCNYLPHGTIGTQNLECCAIHASATLFQMQISTSRLVSDDVNGLMAYFAEHPLEVVYELANPLTIQLTPHEVTALLGSNNIWADSGDSTVEYRVDPTLYLQRLTEPDADMIADANITSGSYFMVGNTLYKATANIASGGAITPNVNCTRKSLSEALNELNS